MVNDAIKCQTTEAPPADKNDFYSGKQDSSEHNSIYYLELQFWQNVAQTP